MHPALHGPSVGTETFPRHALGGLVVDGDDLNGVRSPPDTNDHGCQPIGKTRPPRHTEGVMIMVVLGIPILGVSVEQLMVVAVFGELVEMITTVVWEGRGPWDRRGDVGCFAGCSRC